MILSALCTLHTYMHCVFFKCYQESHYLSTEKKQTNKNKPSNQPTRNSQRKKKKNNKKNPAFENKSTRKEISYDLLLKKTAVIPHGSTPKCSFCHWKNTALDEYRKP